MKKTITLLLATTAFIACKKEETKEIDMSVTYPQTKKVDTIDTYLANKFKILTVGWKTTEVRKRKLG